MSSKRANLRMSRDTKSSGTTGAFTTCRLKLRLGLGLTGRCTTSKKTQSTKQKLTKDQRNWLNLKSTTATLARTRLVSRNQLNQSYSKLLIHWLGPSIRHLGWQTIPKPHIEYHWCTNHKVLVSKAHLDKFNVLRSKETCLNRSTTRNSGTTDSNLLYR